jgi:hypothetical protein
MLHHTFSPSPLPLLIGIEIGIVIGMGFSTLYLNHYLRQIHQRLATLLPEGRRIPVAASSRRVQTLLRVTAPLLFFGSALPWVWFFIHTGTIFSWETLELVISCIVAALLFTLGPILSIRRSTKRLERRLGVAPPQQQTARSRPQPKEAREEE